MSNASLQQTLYQMRVCMSFKLLESVPTFVLADS
jgi:hypothetical protein